MTRGVSLLCLACLTELAFGHGEEARVVGSPGRVFVLGESPSWVELRLLLYGRPVSSFLLICRCPLVRDGFEGDHC